VGSYEISPGYVVIREWPHCTPQFDRLAQPTGTNDDIWMLLGLELQLLGKLPPKNNKGDQP
jgi:hypothetical protein